MGWFEGEHVGVVLSTKGTDSHVLPLNLISFVNLGDHIYVFPRRESRSIRKSKPHTVVGCF